MDQQPSGYGVKFDVEKNVGAITARIQDRMPRAAAVLSAAIQARTPVRTGAMTRAIYTVIGEKSFKVIVGKFYSYFIEHGHRVGVRRSRRAVMTRLKARALRAERKATGNVNLKARESALRARARAEQAEHSAARAAGVFVPAWPFVQPAIDAEREMIIAILAGRQ